MKQFLVAYVHDAQKIVHIGVFNETFNSGKTNAGWKLSAQYGKAKYAAANSINRNSKTAQHVFDSGLHVALLNTRQEDWRMVRYPDTFELSDAYKERDRLFKQYESAGYNVITMTSHKNIRMDGGVGNHGWGMTSFEGKKKLKAANLLRTQIYDMVERLATGIIITKEQLYAAQRFVADSICGFKGGDGTFTCKGEVWAYLNSLVWTEELAEAA